MAHPAQLEFVGLLSEALKPYFRRSRVLEVGSLDVNGSIRGLFTDCDYSGLDVAPGKGVDVVCEGHKYDAADGSFDTVISCEAMEHNPYWEGTFRNMVRLCRPGGVVIMTCATIGRPEHGTARGDADSSPLTVGLGWNYYRNLTPKYFERTIDLNSAFSFHRFWINWSHFDLLFLGFRSGTGLKSEVSDMWRAAERKIDDWLTTHSGARVHLYRAFAAKTLGDSWFRVMHSTMSALSWLHKPR
jgi:SAM-dependent methyltransferase